MTLTKTVIYISIYDSPRSSLLPEAIGAKRLKLTIHPKRFKVMEIFSGVTMEKLNGIKNSECWLEYGGNPFSNIPLLLKLLKQKNKITLDCHNSAVEIEKSKLRRFIVNYFYLMALNKILGVNIIVHNRFIRLPFIAKAIKHTPYPKLTRSKDVKKNIDILFLCSLNSDEPLDLIFSLCKRFKAQGLKVKVTGNGKKVLQTGVEEFLFTKYLTYDKYLETLEKSKLAVCLSTRNKTLLFAPREAISLGVKCLVNDSRANRDFYNEKLFYSVLKSAALYEKISQIVYNESR